jgi:hypothetical protein
VQPLDAGTTPPVAQSTRRSSPVDVTATQVTRKLPKVRTKATSNPGAFLVHIYPTGPYLGSRYALHTVPLVLGRDSHW